jgi:hypothetical protein
LYSCHAGFVNKHSHDKSHITAEIAFSVRQLQTRSGQPNGQYLGSRSFMTWIIIMALDGNLDAVEAFQARGWVYDSANPDRTIAVDILLKSQKVGVASANLYRLDLDQAGIGAGNHAFVFNFDKKLTEAEIECVSARIGTDDGSYRTLKLTPPPAPETVLEVPALQFGGPACDNEQHPVFVLGPDALGANLLVQGLLQLGRFEGSREGYLLDLLAHLSVALNRFYDEKGDEVAPGRDTSIALVPWNFSQKALDAIFIRVVTGLYRSRYWVDRTPNSDMIHLAPRFLRIWPNSRFIFIKRRFLEHAAARANLFPDDDFSHACRTWNRQMAAWLVVREQLHGSAIELDESYLCDRPDQAAQSITDLLNLTETESARLTRFFSSNRIQSQPAKQRDELDIGGLGWRDEQVQDFEQLCAQSMNAYGYSTDSHYYLHGHEANGLVLV